MESTTKNIWKIDPTHSEVGFKVKHMMISTVSGQFTEFDGSVESGSDNFTDAKFTFSAKIDSIDTKNADRDAHLKSEEFFAADRFPELTFTSKSFNGDQITGDLTIRDVTKEVTLDTEFNGVAVDPYGQTKAGFEVSGSISRKDFNLTWNAVTEAGSVVVSDKVRLNANLQFIKQ